MAKKPTSCCKRRPYANSFNPPIPPGVSKTQKCRAIDAGRPHLLCDTCGTKLATPALAEIGIPPEDNADTVRDAAETADRRTEYEVAVSWVKSFRRDRGDPGLPTCFISYAWGDPQHERWVEDLADHLLQAEIEVTLGKWHCRPGTDLARFVERI